METQVRQNSVKAWVLAARPKTLTAASIPILTASALAYVEGGFRWQPCLVCFLFAFLMQIAANMINDLFDFKKGTDRSDRLGPERTCAQGWISSYAMKWGIGVVLCLACGCGLLLLTYGNPVVLIGIGVACVVFAFLYTTMLSYCGLGDLLVLVFFGLVPVLGTYYVETGTFSPLAFLISVICGLLIDTLLVLNNYRDRDTDRSCGKRTLVAILGERFGRYFYLGLGIASWALCLGFLLEGYIWAFILPAFYLIVHIRTWKEMVRIYQGKALNGILGQTSRNMFVFALLLAVGLLLGGTL